MSKDKKPEVKEGKKEISAEVLAISKSARAAMSVDKSTGIASVKEDVDLFKENMPDTVTMEMVKAVGNYKANYIAGIGHALGQVAVEAMASNKKLDEVTGVFNMSGRDRAKFTVQRSREFVNQMNPEGPKIVKHAPITVSLQEKHGKNGGQLKAVREAIAELAMAKLK